MKALGQGPSPPSLRTVISHPPLDGLLNRPIPENEDIFSRVHATLQPAPLVRLLVCRSVTHSFDGLHVAPIGLLGLVK